MRATCRELAQRPLALGRERDGFASRARCDRARPASRCACAHDRATACAEASRSAHSSSTSSGSASPRVKRRQQQAASHHLRRARAARARRLRRKRCARQRLAVERRVRPLQRQHLVADAARKAHAIRAGPPGKNDAVVRAWRRRAARRAVAREEAAREGSARTLRARRLDVDAILGRGPRHDVPDAQRAPA